MKLFIGLIGYCLIILYSCKKTSTELPQGNPNNEITSMVSEHGAAPSSYNSSGNSTSFIRRIETNGDTLIFVGGSMGQYLTSSYRGMRITLKNISSPGVYPFKEDSSVRQQASCEYMIGAFAEFYWTRNSSQPGSITIITLSTTFIQGTFTADCFGIPNHVLITNGKFKGDF